MMTNSMITYRTTFESTNNLPMYLGLGHGESADLIASITDNGVEVDLTGFTARAIYQPKSKFGTDDWYECPCEKVNNTVIVHWTNTQDNGDNAVILWLHFLKDNKVCYPALYKIKLFETPGFSPSAIEVIPETIDFAEYQLLNAPWALQTDFNTLSGSVSSLQTQINTVSGNIPYKYVIVETGDTLTNRAVNAISYNDDFTLTLPSLVNSGLDIVDCILDVFNLNQASDTQITFTLSYDPDDFAIALDEGETLADVMSIKGNTLARYYITQTGFVPSGRLVFHVSKKVIEVANN